MNTTFMWFPAHIANIITTTHNILFAAEWNKCKMMNYIRIEEVTKLHHQMATTLQMRGCYECSVINEILYCHHEIDDIVCHILNTFTVVINHITNNKKIAIL